jgi:hypothetical protein
MPSPAPASCRAGSDATRFSYHETGLPYGVVVIDTGRTASGADQGGTTVIRIRGFALPDEEAIDLYADGDQWTTTRLPGAELVAEGWIVPGLVDAHTHPGSRDLGDPLDEELLREDLRRHVDGGVTLLRAPGLAGNPPDWFGNDPELPRSVHAGRWISPAGGFFDGWALDLKLEELPEAAARQAAATGWAKIIGDWPGLGPIPQGVFAEIVRLVHDAGGRVAVHAQHPESCRSAVLSGVDTIEHGQHLDEDLLPLMAEQGTVLVPTLSVFNSSAAETGHSDHWLAGWQRMGPTTAAAHEAGVTLLAGTDSRPHGRIADEIRALAAVGVPVETALGAGSWTARGYLGFGGLRDGAPADAVVFTTDPRKDLAVLDNPARVILRGRVVR